MRYFIIPKGFSLYPKYPKTLSYLSNSRYIGPRCNFPRGLQSSFPIGGNRNTSNTGIFSSILCLAKLFPIGRESKHFRWCINEYLGVDAACQALSRTEGIKTLSHLGCLDSYGHIYMCFPERRESKLDRFQVQLLTRVVRSTRAFPYRGNRNAVINSADVCRIQSTRVFPVRGNRNSTVSRSMAARITSTRAFPFGGNRN